MGLARKRHFLAAGVAAVAVLGVGVQPAGAAVTIGQVGPPRAGACEGSDLLQKSVRSGNSYTVPGKGTITSWTTHGSAFSGTHAALKVFRLIAAPAIYQVVGHSGPFTIAPGDTAGNAFTATIRVEPGDLLGLNATSLCILPAPGELLQYTIGSGDLDDGSSAAFDPGGSERLNVQATFVPDNTFSLASLRRNKKKGTGTLTFDLPNPGQLSGTGTGAKVIATSPKPEGSVPAPGTGPTQLLVKAKGKKRVRLIESGTVKLRLTVTYTPTGGDPRTSLLKVKLRKKG